MKHTVRERPAKISSGVFLCAFLLAKIRWSPLSKWAPSIFTLCEQKKTAFLLPNLPKFPTDGKVFAKYQASIQKKTPKQQKYIATLQKNTAMK